MGELCANWKLAYSSYSEKHIKDMGDIGIKMGKT